MSVYGQSGSQLDALESIDPARRRALIEGEWVPERLAEFNRSRNTEEGRLQQQIAAAQQMASSPMHMNTSSTPAAVAAIVANALRSFGGMALAGRGETQLKDAQANSAQQYDALVRKGEASTDAVKSIEQARLKAEAVRRLNGGEGYGSDGGFGPWR